MNVRYRVELSQTERTELMALLSGGKHAVRKLKRAQILLAADAGATIFPLIPTFYNHPSSPDDMAQEFANRVLAHIGLPQPNAYRWKG